MGLHMVLLGLAGPSLVPAVIAVVRRLIGAWIRVVLGQGEIVTHHSMVVARKIYVRVYSYQYTETPKPPT